MNHAPPCHAAACCRLPAQEPSPLPPIRPWRRLRLQGPARPEAAGYAEADIADWASTISGWRDAGRDVYAYFVHEDKLHAPQNAMALRRALGINLPGD